MARRRTPTGLSGILAIDKSAGMTSHDVVDAVRRLTKERRVGHAGTLDPLATGLLLVCVGPATRLANYLMEGTKEYQARICFGKATNTDDAEGEVIRITALPEELQDEDYVRQVLFSLQGECSQVPPAFSAIKRDGVKAYHAARAGQAFELEPRQVQLYDAKLLAAGMDYWDVLLRVSKGFYVRSFARDLGEQLGSSAHLGMLRRTASGKVDLSTATPLDSLTSATKLPFIDPLEALGAPVIKVSLAQEEAIRNGRPLEGLKEQGLVALVSNSHLLALYEVAGKSGFAKAKVVIPGGLCYNHAHGISTLHN